MKWVFVAAQAILTGIALLGMKQGHYLSHGAQVASVITPLIWALTYALHGGRR